MCSMPSSLGNIQPVVVVDTPLANRFAGFSVIYNELLTAREMLERAVLQTDPYVVSALWRSGVAIYARCFTSTGSGMPKLEANDIMKEASPELRQLHERLMAIRHGFLSHAGNSELERSSAQAILCDPKVGQGIVALVAITNTTSVIAKEMLGGAISLVAWVLTRAQESMRSAHVRAFAELEATPMQDLYSRAQLMGQG